MTPDHRVGKCKLTGVSGKYVKSHLIPKALTKPSRTGLPFMQHDGTGTSTRRWSSWYDSALVVQVGEDILTRSDTWAIAELRKQKLVWSGWDGGNSLSPSLYTAWSQDHGIRKVEIDSKRSRLFFLSLLWRAAASTLPEFSNVKIPDEDLEHLRMLVLTDDPGSIEFYPTMLTQLSTMGLIHNQVPFHTFKTLSGIGAGGRHVFVPTIRFYFDGLVAHVHCHAKDDGSTRGVGNLFVGASDDLVLSTQSYADSFQRANLERLVNEKY